MGEKRIGDLGLLEELRRFKEALGKRFRVEKMILFGSRARGDHLNLSDVDLIVVSPDFAGMNFLSRIRAVVQFWEADLPLEVLPYTPEEFQRKKEELGIVAMAVKEGIEI